VHLAHVLPLAAVLQPLLPFNLALSRDERSKQKTSKEISIQENQLALLHALQFEHVCLHEVGTGGNRLGLRRSRLIVLHAKERRRAWARKERRLRWGSHSCASAK